MNKINASASYSPLPLDPGEGFFVPIGMNLRQIVDQAPNKPDYFEEFGVVLVNGQLVSKKRWDDYFPILGTLDDPTHVELRVVPRGGGKGSTTKNVAVIVASIALIAATGFIGGGGLALLGASSSLFGAGTLGASLAAAGVGIAGQLAISALTPPPSSGPDKNGQQLDKPSAGITANALAPLQKFPAVRGFARISPVIIAPPYTTLEDSFVYLNVILGLGGGPYDIPDEEILINGNPISSFQDIQYEIHYGEDSDADDFSLANLSVIENKSHGILQNFNTELEANNNDLLLHQGDPDSDLPQPKIHYTKTNGDEYVFRFYWPGGMVKTDDNSQAVTPIRIRGRRRSTGEDWVEFPEFHFSDQSITATPLRQDVKFIFDDAPATPLLGYTVAKSSLVAYWKSAAGKTWQRTAHDFFKPQSTVPLLTANNSHAGYLASASSVNGANAAWRAFDNSWDIFAGTFWQSANAGMPQWLQIDLPRAQKILSYYFITDFDVSGRTPSNFQLQGWNGTTWVVVDTQTFGASAAGASTIFTCNGTVGFYTSYRLNVTRTSGNTGDASVSILLLSEHVMSTSLMVGFDNQPNVVVAGSVDHTDDGPIVYLPPEYFPKGDWEFEIKRGLGFGFGAFGYADDTNRGGIYEYYNGSDTGNLFDYFTTNPGTSSEQDKVRVGQKRFRTDAYLELTQTISYDYPINLVDKNIAAIALKIPSIQVQSISILAKSVVSLYQNGNWSAKGASNNPAELYRDTILGKANATPIPGEVVGDERIQEWHAECVAQGYECNLVIEAGDDAYTTLKQIASAGWAFPRQTGDAWDVIYEYDRSAEPITQLFTSLNTKHISTDIIYNQKLHAIRALWNDEDDNFAVKETIVYAIGFDAETATNIETFSYPGITNELAVINRANLDIGQATYRQIQHVRDVSAEFLKSIRGDLVGITDDVLVDYHRTAYIKSVQYDNVDEDNVIGVTLEATVDLEVDDVSEIDDVTDVSDVTSFSTNRGIFIRCKDGSFVSREINESTQAKVITFVNPVPNDGTIEPRCLASLGIFEKEYSRKLISKIEPVQGLVARITFLDEAPELHELVTSSTS